MSEAKTDARLNGYDAQVFPRRLHELNLIYDRVGGNGAYLEKIGKRASSPEGLLTLHKEGSAIFRPTTSDDYFWFWALSYTIPKGNAAVLFPWAQDWGKKDGLQLDRSIAIYTSGNPSETDTNQLVGRVIAAFEEFETEEKERIRTQHEELARMPAGKHERTTFAP